MFYHRAVFFYYFLGDLVGVVGDVGRDEVVGGGACLVGEIGGSGTEGLTVVAEITARDGLQELQI